MTISTKHKFVSGTSSGLVGNTQWNDDHEILLAAKRIMGRAALTAGPVQEIVIGSGLTLSDTAVLSANPVAFIDLTSKPTTISGYGITDFDVRSIVGNGYQKLPSGLIIQWGTALAGPSNTTLNFPMAFPNAVYSIVTTAVIDNGAGTFVSIAAISAAKTGFVAVPRYAANGGGVAAASSNMNWFAVGA